VVLPRHENDAQVAKRTSPEKVSEIQATEEPQQLSVHENFDSESD